MNALIKFNLNTISQFDWDCFEEKVDNLPKDIWFEPRSAEEYDVCKMLCNPNSYFIASKAIPDWANNKCRGYRIWFYYNDNLDYTKIN